MARKTCRIFFLVIIGFVSIASLSWASSFFQDYGKIRPSAEAYRLFASYTVLPDYRYYISGSDDFPNALIGVDKTYTLEGGLWKEVDMTRAKLKEIIEDMHLKARAKTPPWILHGFDILDNKGKRIGLWYSILEAATNVKMEGDHKVLIYTPKSDVWDRR